MFNEILRSVDEFINGGSSFNERIDTIPIARYLSLAYDIPSDAICKVSRIKMEKIPDIILVSIDCNMENRLCDYTFYEGELVKVISFSPQLWTKSEANKIAMILAILGDINNSLIEAYRPYMDQQMSANSFVHILSFIMAMGYIQSCLPFIDDQIIAVTFRLMYPKITEQSVKSARKLLSQFSVADLLDKCVWYGVTNQEYPDIKFYDIKDAEVKSAVPGKGVWNMSDMEDEEEFPEEELEDPEEEDDYPFNEEETQKYLDAQEAYEEEQSNVNK